MAAIENWVFKFEATFFSSPRRKIIPEREDVNHTVFFSESEALLRIQLGKGKRRYGALSCPCWWSSSWSCCISRLPHRTEFPLSHWPLHESTSQKVLAIFLKTVMATLILLMDNVNLFEHQPMAEVQASYGKNLT